jgi:hypothetical protein
LNAIISSGVKNIGFPLFEVLQYFAKSSFLHSHLPSFF